MIGKIIFLLSLNDLYPLRDQLYNIEEYSSFLLNNQAYSVSLDLAAHL